MLKVAGFELGLCTLYKIHLPTITIMENRVNKYYPYCLMLRNIFISFFQMKVMNTDTMNRILLYLNEKALDTFHTLNLEI